MKLISSIVTCTAFSIESFVLRWAQVTTSGLSGHITDAKKKILVGATVQATYTPTGTKYAAVTDVDGRFRINNMNAGGPYEIVITYVSYKDRNALRDITLQLGETTNLNLRFRMPALN